MWAINICVGNNNSGSGWDSITRDGKLLNILKTVSMSDPNTFADAFWRMMRLIVTGENGTKELIKRNEELCGHVQCEIFRFFVHSTSSFRFVEVGIIIMLCHSSVLIINEKQFKIHQLKFIKLICHISSVVNLKSQTMRLLKILPDFQNALHRSKFVHMLFASETLLHPSAINVSSEKQF